MINFEKYENSKRLKRLDELNVVVHDNMGTLKSMLSKPTEEIVLTKKQLNLIKDINNLIDIESQTNSIWEKLTTTLIVEINKNGVISNEELSSKIDEVSHLGEMALESNVTEDSFYTEVFEKSENFFKTSYRLIIVGFALGFIWSIVLHFLKAHTFYADFTTLYVLLFSFLSFMLYLSSIGNSFIDTTIKENKKLITFMSFVLIVFGVIGLNPIFSLIGIVALIKTTKGLKDLKAIEKLELLNSIGNSKLRTIVANIDDDYYTSKLMNLFNDFPSGANQECWDKLESHLERMNESISIIQNS